MLSSFHAWLMSFKTLRQTWIIYRFSITKESIFSKPHKHEKGWSSVMKITFSKFARNFAFTTDDFFYWFNWTESKITKYHDVDDLHDCENLTCWKWDVQYWTNMEIELCDHESVVMRHFYIFFVYGKTVRKNDHLLLCL